MTDNRGEVMGELIGPTGEARKKIQKVSDEVKDAINRLADLHQYMRVFHKVGSSNTWIGCWRCDKWDIPLWNGPLSPVLARMVEHARTCTDYIIDPTQQHDYRDPGGTWERVPMPCLICCKQRNDGIHCVNAKCAKHFGGPEERMH